MIYFSLDTQIQTRQGVVEQARSRVILDPVMETPMNHLGALLYSHIKFSQKNDFLMQKYSFLISFRVQVDEYQRNP